MLNEKEIRDYAQLMSSRFLEDPGVLLQIGGLERADMLFYLQYDGQIRAFDQQSAVQVLENSKGLLIGYSSNSLNEKQLLQLQEDLKQASLKLMEVATKEELLFMQNNALLAGEVTKPDWYTNYCDGEVFYLMVIVIDQSLKGTGAFRRLLTPVIKECEEKMIPIVLQTHNPENIPIYEHFGFKLMESHTSDIIDLTCFCMML